jgi:hypothetical protein
MANLNPSLGILQRGDSAALSMRKGVDFHCPNCSSGDLKKVSLAYQEGTHRVKTRTGLLGLVFGEAGPGLAVGRARTRGIQQTELSKALSPPRKWSYARLILRSLLVTACGLGAYVVFVESSTPPVSTLPLKLYVFLGPMIFTLFALVVWRHNRLVYPLLYTQWDRSFLCQRCGTVSLHGIPPPFRREP